MIMGALDKGACFAAGSPRTQGDHAPEWWEELEGGRPCRGRASAELQGQRGVNNDQVSQTRDLLGQATSIAHSDCLPTLSRGVLEMRGGEERREKYLTTGKQRDQMRQTRA